MCAKAIPLQGKIRDILINCMKDLFQSKDYPNTVRCKFFIRDILVAAEQGSTHASSLQDMLVPEGKEPIDQVQATD